jgi:hypothetical protein
VMLIRDPLNPTHYRVDGRDTSRYGSWGTNSSYLPKHGAQHSFSPTGRGGDITWIYSPQIMPWNVIPSGTYGSDMVLISGYPFYSDNRWVYAGNTGTSSLSAYAPSSGTYARMVLVYLDANGNPGLEAGVPFNALLVSGTVSLMPYIPSPPSGTNIPLAAIWVGSGTNRYSWEQIYDLRPFFNGVGSGGGSTPPTPYVPPESLIRLWDFSASEELTYVNSDAGLASALGDASDYDVLFLPPGHFTGNYTIPPFITVIGTEIFGTGDPGFVTFFSGDGTVLTVGQHTTLSRMSVSATSSIYATPAAAIDADGNDIYLVNVFAESNHTNSGSSYAVVNGYGAQCVGCVLHSTYNNGAVTKPDPFDYAPIGSFIIDGPEGIFENTQVVLRSNDISNPPTAAQLTGVFGSPSVVGDGFVGLINDNGDGVDEYLVWTDGTNWFYVSGTLAL